jgi:3-oxoacyl-[acyl-carrier protein] reductase
LGGNKGSVRTVFVVGASSAIGLAVCRLYLDHGWGVLAHFNKNRQGLDKLLSESDGRLELIQIPFGQHAVLEEQLSSLRSRYIHCDALVTCAATLVPREFNKLDLQSVIDHLSINLFPSLLLMRDLGSNMASRGWGRIVHLGSIGVKFGGGKNSFAYALSKHALELFPQESRSWAKNNVLINTIRVGVTRTSMHDSDKKKDLQHRASLIPMKRVAEPWEIAQNVWFLGSELNSLITGQVIAVSGGE